MDRKRATGLRRHNSPTSRPRANTPTRLSTHYCSLVCMSTRADARMHWHYLCGRRHWATSADWQVSGESYRLRQEKDERKHCAYSDGRNSEPTQHEDNYPHFQPTLPFSPSAKSVTASSSKRRRKALERSAWHLHLLPHHSSARSHQRPHTRRAAVCIKPRV